MLVCSSEHQPIAQLGNRAIDVHGAPGGGRVATVTADALATDTWLLAEPLAKRPCFMAFDVHDAGESIFPYNGGSRAMV